MLQVQPLSLAFQVAPTNLLLSVSCSPVKSLDKRQCGLNFTPSIRGRLPFIPVKWQSTLEPVLGTLVNFLGMRRVNTRGLELAGKCMLMAAVCYNLKKLLKFRAPKAVAKVVRMAKRAEKEAKAATLLLFAAKVLQGNPYNKIKLQ